MVKATVYHNPRCSKSREALALLQAHGVEAQVVEYLKTPLTVTQLQSLVKQLGKPARELLRTKEPLFKELGLDKQAASDAAVCEWIAAHPILMERPVVVIDQKAVIARPTDALLALIGR